MHRDFLEAIYHNHPLKVVYDRLDREQRARHELESGRLYREYDTAQKILLALHEHPDSAPCKWARAYMAEAEKAEASKDQATKEWEAKRRELEAEYLRLKELEVEEMRQHHSEH